MPINFPNSPSLNDLYSYDNKTWEWNGIYWEVYSALTSYITSAYTAGDGVSDISGVTNGNLVLKSFSGVNITIIDNGNKLTFSGSSGNITGGGTSNYLPKWSGSTSLVDSLVYDSSTGVTIGTGFTWNNTNSRLGIGTTSPTYKFEVRDTGSSSVTHFLGFKNDNNDYGGITIGSGSGQNLTIQQNTGYGYLATSGFRIGSSNGVIWTNNGSIFRIVDPATEATNYLRIANTTGNVLINTGTDAGYKLDVNGSVRVNTNLWVNNIFAQTSQNLTLEPGSSSNYVRIKASHGLSDSIVIDSDFSAATISSEYYVLKINPAFAPTSGNSVKNYLGLTPIINQLSGASGVTRGVYVNPTLTSAYDFRAIETTAGSVLFRNGNIRLMYVNPSGNGNVIIGNTTIDRGDKLQVEGSVRVGSVLLTNTIYPLQNANLLISAAWADSTQVVIETITNKAQVLIVRPGANLTLTSGTHDTQRITHTFQPTGGNASVNGLTLNQTINQLSGASGTTRGIYINPTISAATDFRAIETTVGNVMLNTVSGNTLIGTTTDTGIYKLDVNGNSRIKGAGATSSTNAFIVQNSAGNAALTITNGLTTVVNQDLELGNTVIYWNGGSQIRNISNGVLRLTDSTAANFTRLQFGGGTTSYPALQRSGSALSIMDASGTSSTNLLVGTTTDAGYRLDVNGTGRFVGTILSTGAYSVSSGTYDIFNNSTSVVPTSGNMVVNGFAYNSTINQTGGASGITRGIHINPTLTSAFDFRGIQWTNNTGYGLYGSGNAPNYLQGNTLIGTTANTGTFKLDVRGNTRFSASTGTSLTVISSGNSTSAPVFSVQGSQGELFSVTDSLTGSLFSVSDISGLPILEVFSDSTTIIGDYQAPSLYTTKRVTSITASTGTAIYSFPVSAYTSAFVDYYVTSATGMRAGNMMAIWSGTTVQSTETSTNDIGNTSPVTFGWRISGSSAVLSASASTGTWTVESILRGL